MQRLLPSCMLQRKTAFSYGENAKYGWEDTDDCGLVFAFDVPRIIYQAFNIRLLEGDEWNHVVKEYRTDGYVGRTPLSLDVDVVVGLVSDPTRSADCGDPRTTGADLQ